MAGAILVIRGGAIGDFILTLPVLAALRARFPAARLEVLGYPHVTPLALAGGLADAIHSIDARGLASFFAPGGSLAEEFSAFFARFAVIVSFLYDPDGVFQSNVRRCSGAQFIAGPHRPGEGGRTHATEVLLQPLERLTIQEADPTPRLRLRPVSALAANEAGPRPVNPAGSPPPRTPWFAVHPGSGSPEKNWPQDQWAALLTELAAATHWNLLLVGGPAEGDRLDRLVTCWPAGRRAVAQSLPLVELASRLGACGWFVGHDSGITHLAAALGRPSLVLWGKTNADVWRPRTPAVRLLQAPAGLTQLSVGQVRAALFELAAAADHA